MTAAETGIYITLIATMYESGEPIRADEKRLARLCGASNSTFKACLASLVGEGKITSDNGLLWNDRVQKEVSYRSEKSQVGRNAANALWEKKRNENNGWVDANAMPSLSDRYANQKPEPDTIKKEAPTVPKGTARKPKAVDEKLYAEFEQDVWKEFPRHPNSRKDPAFKKYSDLPPELRARCIGGVARYSQRFDDTIDPKRSKEERLDFVPHLVTWINQKGWEAEYDRQS